MISLKPKHRAPKNDVLNRHISLTTTDTVLYSISNVISFSWHHHAENCIYGSIRNFDGVTRLISVRAGHESR